MSEKSRNFFVFLLCPILTLFNHHLRDFNLFRTQFHFQRQFSNKLFVLLYLSCGWGRKKSNKIYKIFFHSQVTHIPPVVRCWSLASCDTVNNHVYRIYVYKLYVCCRITFFRLSPTMLYWSFIFITDHVRIAPTKLKTNLHFLSLSLTHSIYLPFFVIVVLDREQKKKKSLMLSYI